MKNTKFFTCYQNNSGGFDYQDENVDKFVCVEAKDVVDAQKKFKKILRNYRCFCPCCGIRWDDNFLTEDFGCETPCINGVNYKDIVSSFYCSKICKFSIVIYYISGKKVIHPLWKNHSSRVIGENENE